MAPSASPGGDSTSLKLALAVALLRFKNHHHRPPSSSSSDPDAQRWKQKAKERKRELQKLREDLKQLEDGMKLEDLPQIASCRCHFFDGCGDLRGDGAAASGGEHWIDEVLRRRFLRLVRWKERRKRLDRPIRQRDFLELGNEDEVERLGTSVDFLVELSNNILVKGGIDSSFTTFSHQAVDFILASIKNLLSSQKDRELIEEIVNGLISRLTKRMCTMTDNVGPSNSGSDSQFCVQHLMRKLGNESFIGHRIILSVSQKISIAAETLLVMDPFDEAFLTNHDSLFMMIQLIEFLISDYMQNWTRNGDFDTRIFEEWVRSILQARKVLEVLECRNGLYMLFMERVIGELAKQVAPFARQGKIDLDILSNIFC